MSWFTLSVVGYLILAAVSILDKIILTKAAKPAVFTFYNALFVAPLVLLLPFGVKTPDSVGFVVVAVAAMAFLFGLWTMYRGIEMSEISHIGPFIGAAAPFFTVFLGRFFLGETLSARQLLAITLLIGGSIVIAFEKSKKHNGIHIGMAWGTAAGLSFAVSNVASKYLYDGLGFYSGFVLSRVAIGVLGLSLLVLPAVRRGLAAAFAGNRLDAHPRRPGAMFASRVLAVVGVILVQYAIALGSVSIVNAMEGLRYAALIIAVALLSRFAPKIFKEDYGPAEMAQEVAAAVIIGVGLLLII